MVNGVWRCARETRTNTRTNPYRTFQRIAPLYRIWYCIHNGSVLDVLHYILTNLKWI